MASRMAPVMSRFPELALTGYTCGDLFLQDALLDSAKEALAFLLKKSKGYDMLTVVGMPVTIQAKLYNTAVFFQVIIVAHSLADLAVTLYMYFSVKSVILIVVLAVDRNLEVGAHLALDGDDGAVGVGDSLTLGHLTDHTLAGLGECNDRGGGTGAFCVGDDNGFAAFQNSDAGIGST